MGGNGEGGNITISSKKLCLTVPKKILEGTVWCFSSFGFVEKLCLRGYVTIFCQKFFVSKYRKPRNGTFLCFTKFLVSKKFMDKRGGRGRRCYQNFLSNFFFSLPKDFVAEPFSVPLFSSNEKCLGYGLSTSSVNFFLSQIAEKYFGGTVVCCVSQNFRW